MKKRWYEKSLREQETFVKIILVVAFILIVINFLSLLIFVMNGLTFTSLFLICGGSVGIVLALLFLYLVIIVIDIMRGVR